MLTALQEECKQYLENNKYVFKKCSDYIVILRKPISKFKSNEERKNIVDKNFAKFRGNAFIVEDIIHYKTRKHFKFISHCPLRLSPVLYMVGRWVEPDNFDDDLELVCTHGIHYYLTLEAAFYHGLNQIKTGTTFGWYSNGSKSYEYNFKDGKKDGFQMEWCRNGSVLLHSLYNKGKRHGYQYSYGNKTLYYYGHYITEGDYVLT